MEPCVSPNDSDEYISYDEFLDEVNPDIVKMLQDLRVMRKERKLAVKKVPLKIYMTSLVEEFKSFELENIRNIRKLSEKVTKVLDVPSKNILFYQDKEKTKRLKFSNDYYDAVDYKESIVIYFVVKPNIMNYIIYENFGRTKMGKVYKCRYMGKKEFVMLKKFRIDDDKEEELKELMKEYELYIKLGDHPRIVKCNGYFRTEKASFIQLEYMTGGSLRDFLRENGPQKEPNIIRFAKQILEGIDYLHRQNIIHRDLKGAKVLLDENLNVRLCGFRSSKCFSDISSENFRVAAGDSSFGTYNWTAPEVMTTEGYGSSADIWSFGAIMIELITGKVPYHVLTPFQAIFRIGTTKKIDFMYPNGSSSKLKAFTDWCLKSDPKERPTVKELLAHEFLN